MNRPLAQIFPILAILIFIPGCNLDLFDPGSNAWNCRSADPAPCGWTDWDALAVIAHRGFSCCYPENTLEAIDQAILAGADAVEVDVRITADGVPILLHDESLRRTTDRTGSVSSLDWDIIRNADACPELDQRCSVPTLRQAMSHAEGRIRLVLDIGPGQHPMRSPRIVADVIANHSMGDRVAVITNEPLILAILRSRFPDIPLALYDGSRPTRADTQFRNIEFMTELQPAEIMLTADLVLDGDPIFRRAVEHGVPVIAWTASTTESLQALLSTTGVHRVLTDVPRALP